ncbi:MAG TPA: aminopeptidase [Ktedonobacteraceae bacterium]|nr:aminopeptidase [Ktedonobacteraceae bacterium]
MTFSENRLSRMAQVLVRYSLEVQPGQLVAVMAGVEAIPLVREVYREVLRAGAHPELQLEMDEAEEIYLKEASEEQLNFVSPLKQLINEHFDRLLYIDADTNTRRLTRIDPKRSALVRKAYDATMTVWSQRAARGEMRWCYTQYPTNAYAQSANMSLEDYWEFMSNACMLNEPDPLASWKSLSERHQQLIGWLQGRKQVHIIGKDTDLTLSIEGRSFLTCDGHINFPDGEVYTGPVEDSAQGTIRFTLPSSYDGHPVDDIRLRFEHGRVIEATAASGEDFLLKMLDIGEGARRIGEFAFGTNYGVREATRNTLYDEKIGGTLHMALGRSYPESGGLNVSALHWDMVCDLRGRGEVWVDGEVFLKDGQYSLWL